MYNFRSVCQVKEMCLQSRFKLTECVCFPDNVRTVLFWLFWC